MKPTLSFCWAAARRASAAAPVNVARRKRLIMPSVLGEKSRPIRCRLRASPQLGAGYGSTCSCLNGKRAQPSQGDVTRGDNTEHRGKAPTVVSYEERR